MNILVVDSDRVSRRLAALLLGRLDAAVPVLAETVADALAAARAMDAPPARGLVLCAADDAVQDLHTLRAALGPQARLVAMLARDAGEARRACLDAGADEVIAKPLTLDLLTQLLARATADTGDFDRAAWSGLRELFGAAGVATLCTALVDDLPVQQAHLADAIRDQDLAALKRIAHSLRSVCLQLGAAALAGQWTRAEQAAAADDATALPLGSELMLRYAALIARLQHESAS